jgi:phosphatidylserine/phosphatidylglycerophosphate/cardiolipin synthase-like enzyme
VDRSGQHIPFAESGSYPIRGGNRVRPLVDGEPAFQRICESIDSAQHSVWVTVAFLDPTFQLPDRRGSFFDALDRAYARGLDVRALFWRCAPLHKMSPDAHFFGDARQLEMLRSRGSCFLARWDRAAKLYCHHQKSWLIDAGNPGEVAFVGGINLNPNSVVPPGHPLTHTGKSTHDVYVEIEGPSAGDVHHNFVQRWNGASDRHQPDGLWPETSDNGDLTFPDRAAPPVGEVAVQIQRTVRREQYRDDTASPGADPFPIVEGEYSVRAQYLSALAAARRTIYVEDQALGSPEFVEALHDALGRGVEVVVLLPVDPNEDMAASRTDLRATPFWERLHALGGHERFTLAGIARNGNKPGDYQNVYVHAKIALIDDVWATIGSANIANRSFYGDTELNASFWHRSTVTELRRNLLLEHLGQDTAELDDVSALRLYARIARENAERRSRSEPLEGLAFALDPRTYAT